MQAYAHTHNGTARIEWPDGGCYLEQSALLVEVWEMITAEIQKLRDEVRR